MNEPVESFRARARRWLKENLPPAPEKLAADGDEQTWERARVLQKRLYEGGFAGICFPREYGGLGLTQEHQRAFTEESLAYEMPLVLNMPTFGVCAPTILDCGTEEQKREHLRAVLAGDEILVQFLSEPRGGSDLAGLTTRAERDGDMWILNGSKIWSSSAYAADYALCLARTDWDAPKHRGLTMFLMPVHAEGVTIQRIRQTNGSDEFCQEFFDNVMLPDSCVLGEVNGGWAVASRQLYHERSAMGGGSPYFSGARPRIGGEMANLIGLARETGQLDDPRVREDIGAAQAMRVIENQLVARVGQAIASGTMDGPAASVIRLFKAESILLQSDLALRIGGAAGVTGGAGEEHGLGQAGQDYIYRQANAIAGGSVEMARNVISERVLGMPREYAADRDVPFRQVKQGR
ncbi:acyl-CoA dehydrogenase [Amycolatopsis acidicola]|uniref:Acyl-CoA dehydrogenase n=1 Tax=Amycolatopsis acidicola TaxID=2596893 RepID=A0A5N0UKU2_9PSEU|nr:acyl-CoA dehydrogenase family protein [Amycolatopsis acidicola]KAA9149886.1 acyl-CoA dehydrogenase [Amycolatopsis acidicola]